ncbi:MAG: YtxH domain-containing protein [Deltaproteobacteria bacterium]
METNSELKFPSFIIGMALGAVAGLLLAPRRGEETRKYLRERSTKGLDTLNQQAAKVLETADEIVKKGKEFIGPHRDSVKTDREAEKHGYQEDSRGNSGG